MKFSSLTSVQSGWRCFWTVGTAPCREQVESHDLMNAVVFILFWVIFLTTQLSFKGQSFEANFVFNDFEGEWKKLCANTAVLLHFMDNYSFTFLSVSLTQDTNKETEICGALLLIVCSNNQVQVTSTHSIMDIRGFIQF